MALRETREHGNQDFPMNLYQIGHKHPRYEMVCHWHAEYELIQIKQGTMMLTLNEQRYSAHAGDIFIIASGVLHSAIPVGIQCEYDCIVFDLSYFAGKDDACSRLIGNVSNYSVLINEQINASDPEISEITNRLFEVLSSKQEGYQLVAKGLFYQLFGLIYKNKLYTRKAVPNNRNKKRVTTLKNVLAVIEESYAFQIGLKDLADTAEMSPGYFCVFFREMTNKTPIEYLIGYRIDQACRQLKSSDLSVTEIALGCGFNDLSHFIKTFKKLKHTTPEQFRQNL